MAITGRSERGNFQVPMFKFQFRKWISVFDGWRLFGILNLEFGTSVSA
jgi:hypothetical protein